MFKKILHANDGSEGAFRALATAIELAKDHGAELHVVAVEEMQWMPGSREEVIGEKELENHHLKDAIKQAKRQAKKQKVEITAHLLIGHPVNAISEFTRQKGFDALVIGYVGHSRLHDMLIGGTADRLVRLAPCTVIVVK